MNRSSSISAHESQLLLAALLLLFYSNCPTCNALATSNSKTYNYFAYGSNMASSTMINLRNLSPLASSAAVLPGHSLRFNIPGVPGVEPSSAAVEPAAGISLDDDDAILKSDEVVHGVLYKLTAEDFATVCQTEGVPFGYSLHRCRAIPYTGDGKTAGQEALSRALTSTLIPEEGASSSINMTEQQSRNNSWGVSAFTLRASRKEWRREGTDIPPSQSYLNVLIRGANEFALDKSYTQNLENIQVGRTWIGNGLAEDMLRRAERRKST